MDFTFKNWIEKGTRVSYNFEEKIILPKANTDKTTVSVYQQTVNQTKDSKQWITMLSGYPDGSFGWTKVEHYLKDKTKAPRLYVEYIGQGDSDKPDSYDYSTMERADLVEAHWQHQQIKSTFIVAFDYSSLVVLELLKRQQERITKKQQPIISINTVLFINGGYFTDAHSHPYLTTPFLKTSLGKLSTKMVQQSKMMFVMYLKMIKNMWSPHYKISESELNEFYKAITHRNGAVFMSNSAGFVDEHRQEYSTRWNLETIYLEMKDTISFHIVGSEEDIFEPQQLIKAEKRLGKYGIDIRKIPGGHFCTLEQPEIVANIIHELY